VINLSIDNPEIEDFVKNEFKGDANSLVSSFVEYIKLQKIKNDIRISIKEFERGEFLEIDESFNRVLEKI